MRGRLLLFSVPLLTAVFAIGTALVEKAEQRRLRDELRHKIELTAQINARVLAEPLWYVNTESLSATLDILLGDADIVSARALDAEQAVLAWSGEDSSIDLGSFQLFTEAVFFEHLGLRQEAGTFEIYFTEARLAGLLAQRLRLYAALYAVALAALLAAVFRATQRAVNVPLARWRRALSEGGEGELRAVDWTSPDEIGEAIGFYNEKVAAALAMKSRTDQRLSTFEDAVASLHRGLCVFDRDFRLVAFNQRYLEIMKSKEGAVRTGMSLSDLLRANAANGEYGSANVDAVIIDRLAIAAANEVYRRERVRPDGSVIEVESTPLPEGGFVSVYSDVTPQKQLESQLRQMTLNDPATRLPNRALFLDRLRQALALVDRTGTRLAVLMLDVDHFGEINEGHGRAAGDAVLLDLAARLRRLVRKSDTLARLENDRFAMIQQRLDYVDDAALFAHRVLGSMSRPFEVGSRSLLLNVSIGITIYPDDDKDSRHILKHSILALTAAKAEGRGRYRYFVPETDQAVAERRDLEEELFKGLRQHEFVLHYQPQVDPGTGAVSGAEALVRWWHPARGLMLPADFMKLAEERGLIVPLTEWILEEACRQRGQWQARHRGSVWPVAVNLSARHFKEGDVVGSVEAALEKTELEHRFLEVEVSAEASLAYPERVAESLAALRSLGVAAVMDGFGNGVSPLNSIRRLPLDGVKLDRKLVHELEAGSQAATIVRAVVALGRQLDLRIGAAGVEETTQLDLLRDEGCDQVQGNVFSQPLPGDELSDWVSGRSLNPSEPSRGTIETAS